MLADRAADLLAGFRVDFLAVLRVVFLCAAINASVAVEPKTVRRNRGSYAALREPLPD